MENISQCDPLVALNDALCREQEVVDFYLKASKRTKNNGGIQMFNDLAEEASLQVNLLEKQIEVLTENNTWMLPDCVLACEYNLENAPYPRTTKTLNREIGTDTNEVDAILYALKAENVNYGVYVKLAKSTSNDEARKFYTYLAEKTQTRLDLLMLSYEAVTVPSIID
jgi:rubrerythrin